MEAGTQFWRQEPAVFLPLSPDFLMQLRWAEKAKILAATCSGMHGVWVHQGCPDLNPVGTRGLLRGTNRHRPNWELRPRWPELNSATGGPTVHSGDFPNRPWCSPSAWEVLPGPALNHTAPRRPPSSAFRAHARAAPFAGNTTPPSPSPGLSFPTPPPAKSLTSVRLSAAPDQGQCLLRQVES